MSNFDDFIDSAKQKFAIGSMVLLTIFTIINAAIVTFNQNYNGFVIVFVIVSSALVLALGIIIYLIRRHRRLQCPITHKTVINVIRREGYYPKQDNSGQISFEVNNDETYLTWFDSSRFALIYGFKLAGDEQQIRDVVLQANQNIAMQRFTLTLMRKKLVH